QECERRHAVEDPDALVIDRRHPRPDARALARVDELVLPQRVRDRHHFSPVRYAATAFACSSVRPRSGIFTPGLSRCGSRTHAATLSGVFGHMPAASMVRPPKWLRFGPSTRSEERRVGKEGRARGAAEDAR